MGAVHQGAQQRVQADVGQPLEDLVRRRRVRLLGQQTSNNRNIPSNVTFGALSAANDARNGQFLHYLLATNQINASASGASGGG